MKLTYEGPFDVAEIPEFGVVCARGETVDVDDISSEVLDALEGAGWRSGKTKPGKTTTDTEETT